MANLKQDLMNELRNQIYYTEQNLQALVLRQDIPYLDKLNEIRYTLEKIAGLNQSLALANNYFPDAPPTQNQQNLPNGQSHQE